MVEAEVRRAVSLAAVLTYVVVPREQVPPVELDVLLGQLGEGQDADDPRNHKVEPDRPNPIVSVGLELLLKGAKLGPVREVVGDVSSILDADDLGDGPSFVIAFEEECERPPHADHAHGHVVRVKQQDVTVQVRCRIDRSACREDSYSSKKAAKD